MHINLRNLGRRVATRITARKNARPGYVDFAGFESIVSYHRERGVTIGEKVRLLGHIDSHNPHLISIGDYSVIGVQSALLTHCPIKGALPVMIGRFVYLAFGALVLPGVSIGDRCVVGAGSVVTKSMPEASVVAGNPARVLRALSPQELERISRIFVEERLFGWEPVPERKRENK